MKARTEALLRLYLVQAAWTYERMAGIGVGHAAEPLLRDLYASRSGRERRDAVARSADFFNSHPYLAGIAVGAVVRAEREQVPGETISRLRLALSGPLGALGDQLIWAGWVPALIGLALVAAPWWGGAAVIAAVVLHNVFRVLLTRWGLDLGLREGLGVGAALQHSWLIRGADRAQRLAALTVGAALPVVTWWIIAGTPSRIAAGVVGAGIAGAVLTVWSRTRARITGLRIGLVLLVATVLLMEIA